MRTFTKHTKDTLYFKWWNDLIMWYFDWIQKYIDDNNIEWFKITCMKVKYGWLRIEQEWWDNMLFDMCTNLENDSEKTCCVCWWRWIIRYDFFWFQCLCRKHYIPKKITLLYSRYKKLLPFKIKNGKDYS